MVCNTLRAAASVLAEHMATKRDQSISVNVMPVRTSKSSIPNRLILFRLR